jgi:hypothetical protein
VKQQESSHFSWREIRHLRKNEILSHSFASGEGSVSKSLDGITLISIVKVIVQLNLIDGLI